MTDSEKKKEFMILYKELHGPLLRFARAMTRNREDAKDLASETILIAYENFHKVKNRQMFLSYLFSIATRLHKRRRWRLRLFGEYDETRALQITADTLAPDSSLDIEALYIALDKLPSKMKETVVLFEISGLSIKEIVDIQGGTISGVKSRLVRGRELLKSLLSDEQELTNSIKTENSKSKAENVKSIMKDKQIFEAGAL